MNKNATYCKQLGTKENFLLKTLTSAKQQRRHLLYALSSAGCHHSSQRSTYTFTSKERQYWRIFTKVWVMRVKIEHIT